MRSAEQRARRDAEDRDRRAAESPASRQARLASDKAARRLCSPLSTLHHHQPTCWKYKTDRMGYPCPVTKTRLVELQLPESGPCEEAADEEASEDEVSEEEASGSEDEEVSEEEVSEDEGVVSFACYSCGGDGNDARDGAGVGDACAGVRVQRQQSPAVFASPKAAGLLYLMLMKYGCPNNSNIAANRLLFNPAGEGPARMRAVQG